MKADVNLLFQRINHLAICFRKHSELQKEELAEGKCMCMMANLLIEPNQSGLAGLLTGLVH